MTNVPYGHDSRAIANEILRIADQRKIKLTIMQLLKLCFFAHGWTLARLQKPLSRHPVEAWKYGPVYPLVYKAFPEAGSVAIGRRAKDGLTHLDVIENFNEQERKILEAVVDGYGTMHAFELSGLTHQEGSPWQKTVQEKGVYSVIPETWIKEYFSALQDKNG